MKRAAHMATKVAGPEKLRQLVTLCQSGKLSSELGVGGLDHVFADLFRRVLGSRLLPPAVSKTLGLRHVRGVLLYGPPGTGKTLVARKISRLLTTRTPTMVAGPEVFSHLLGSR